MSRERPTLPVEAQQPEAGFGFTEQEQLYHRVSDARLKAILADPQTAIHRVDESTNNYGEFLFVTVGRVAGARSECVTFYGLGYHEQRERWLTREWFWYRANPFPEMLREGFSRQEARELLQLRRTWIAPFVTEEPQSERGRLFEMLADLTDEDGAYVELEDLADWLGDDFE